MASLSQRPRKSKKNPFPKAQPPLARWTKNLRDGYVDYVALRADGSVVSRNKYPTWTSGWVIMYKGPFTIEHADEIFLERGFTRDAQP